MERSENPHILTPSPPISLEPRGLGPHIAYTIAKYGMSLFLCKDVLAEDGVTDFDAYAYVPGATPHVGLFVDHV
jgi:citronellol/citronellal dehydrogenase